MSFNFDNNEYIYSQLSPNLFCGFEENYDNYTKAKYLESTVEKALLDYIYLNGSRVVADLCVDQLPDSFDVKRYNKFLEKYPKWMQELSVF